MEQPANLIVDGVWPTMVTPFTESNEIDFKALEKLVEWYIAKGVDGLFAVCQSSEMFKLSLEERVQLAGFVKKQAAGRVPVIASGHVSDSIQDQIEEIKAISAVGIDAFVMVSNRLAAQDESDDVWKRNAEIILAAVPDVAFGIYECPFPYKRLMSPELLAWCASTGRFLFLKDTCCDVEQIQAKLDAVKGSQLKIFNANSATLLETLKIGAAGFSGIMANFHPDLYAWLFNNWNKDSDKAALVQSYLGVSSMIEHQLYPLNAKYYLQQQGLGFTLQCRARNQEDFITKERLVMDQMKQLDQWLGLFVNGQAAVANSIAK
ncbi:dihydrodipicolinate synthase family protein [Paenibacillus sp. WQ 127069]|uniref:Dihydrodipicolinate synthase family protein n=1 Tax=Paenibacillus baimaensis TaxID=2982185 RepID=A0ABT2UL83_9BACL|nr:dihydrodipicolinate synthase family protein [Paenibacillus sp. WQ 127069]MCU6794637.1 dihydrodipicolinate synthase family protein [Paenibacillus sp. WQ 127069]